MSAAGVPAGWVRPAYPSLARRPLFFGLPYNAGGGLITLMVLLGPAMHQWIAMAVLCGVAYAAALAITRRDPYAFDVLVAAMREPPELRSR